MSSDKKDVEMIDTTSKAGAEGADKKVEVVKEEPYDPFFGKLNNSSLIND